MLPRSSSSSSSSVAAIQEAEAHLGCGRGLFECVCLGPRRRPKFAGCFCQMNFICAMIHQVLHTPVEEVVLVHLTRNKFINPVDGGV